MAAAAFPSGDKRLLKAGRRAEKPDPTAAVTTSPVL